MSTLVHAITHYVIHH